MAHDDGLDAGHRSKYRPDIDGLRAIAVLAVLAYHFGFVSGGFVGVDVFFVISGYFITGILVDELAGGTFGLSSLAQFYVRRIRRITPALTAVCLASVVAAYVLLFPSDLIEFGRSLQSVAVMISNYHFQRKTDYFDGAADEKPLLHTWSLGVEEQYYLAFPIALWAVWRWGGRRAALIICLAGAIASLGYAETTVQSNSAVAFFSTPARIWELLTGALLAIGRDQLPSGVAVREGMATVGAMLIGWACLMFTPETTFPGLSATIPVLGSAFVIAAGERSATGVGRILASGLLAGIGLISYSVYLWHWPLMVFTKYRLGPFYDDNWLWIAPLLFLGSLAAGYLSWRFIEQPFRKRGRTSGRGAAFAAQLCLAAATLLAGTLYSKSNGLPGRFSADVLAMLNPQTGAAAQVRSSCKALDEGLGKDLTLCSLGTKSPPPAAKVLLWGDSHAGMLREELTDLAGPNDALLTAVRPGCPPISGVVLGGRGRSEACQTHNANILKYLEAREPRVERVILVARWPYYAEGTRMPYEPGQGVVLGAGDLEAAPGVLADQLAATVATLLKYVGSVVILAPFPEFDRPVATTMARAAAWNYPEPEKKTRASVTQRQATSIQALEKARRVDEQRVTIVSFAPYFCDETFCTFENGNGMPLYRDTNHLNALGIERIRPMLEGLVNTRGSTEPK